MATLFYREGLELILGNVIADARARGVSSIADFSTVVHLSSVSILAYSGRVVQTITTTARLTYHFATGTADQESCTVYELAKDKHSPPFKTYTEYTRTSAERFAADSSSPFILGSVIEDESASQSNLLDELATFFVNRAKKAIKDRERVL